MRDEWKEGRRAKRWEELRFRNLLYVLNIEKAGACVCKEIWIFSSNPSACRRELAISCR